MALQRPSYYLFKKNVSPLIFHNIFRKTSGQALDCARVFPNCHREIGCREIVGHGINGDCSYTDNVAFPFPAIRFREVTADLLPLKEKEKGDWRNLSLEEKKTLYRASFCQTYAEMLVPSKEWKHIVGKALVLTSLGVWLYLAFQFIWTRIVERPKSFEKERQMAQLERILVLEVNPIQGLSSKWDYENDRWK